MILYESMGILWPYTGSRSVVVLKCAWTALVLLSFLEQVPHENQRATLSSRHLFCASVWNSVVRKAWVSGLKCILVIAQSKAITSTSALQLFEVIQAGL